MANKKEKIQGIYRVYLEHSGTQYSYVGISKNIEERIKFHSRGIKNMFNDDKGFLSKTLASFSVPVKNAFYWKATVFLYLNHLTPAVMQWEVLERIGDEYNNIDTQFKEMEYITKYNSEMQGFNGMFAKDFQIAFTLLSPKTNKKTIPTLHKLKREQNKKNNMYYLQLKNFINKWEGTKEDLKKHTFNNPAKKAFLNNFMWWMPFQIEGMGFSKNDIKVREWCFYFHSYFILEVIKNASVEIKSRVKGIFKERRSTLSNWIKEKEKQEKRKEQQKLNIKKKRQKSNKYLIFGFSLLMALAFFVFIYILI